MPGAIRIKREVFAVLADLAQQQPLMECCGLLAGRDDLITRALPAANATGNPATAYEIAAEELFRLMRTIRAEGLDLLGIYHSHPAGDNRPSERDIDRAFYPAAAYFIVSPHTDAPRPVRAFSIREGHVTELEIREV